jgi:YD repeat-containing protein
LFHLRSSRGPAVPILEQVAYSSTTGAAKFDTSQSGTLIYENGVSSAGLVTLQWLEESGKTQPLIAKPGNYGRPSFSPDGRRLALEVLDGSNQDIWVQDLERDTMTRLTFDGKGILAPIWTPDGRAVLVGNKAVTGAGPGSAAEFQYDNNSLSHGNLTQESRWDSTLGSLSAPLTGCPQSTSPPSGCNAWVITHAYDQYGNGNLTNTTDALGYQTQLTYDSSNLCLTTVTLGSGARNFSYPTACDLYTSLPTKETDVDHGITRTFAYDTFGRSAGFTDVGSGNPASNTPVSRKQQTC